MEKTVYGADDLGGSAGTFQTTALKQLMIFVLEEGLAVNL